MERINMSTEQETIKCDQAANAKVNSAEKVGKKLPQWMSLKHISPSWRKNQRIMGTAKEVLREKWQLYMFISDKEKNDLYRQKYKSLLGDMK